jgi:hypothetical protein
MTESRSWRLLGFVAIATLYLAIPNARPDFTRFNCQDSSSYLALAQSLAHGRGYTRSLVADVYVPHTTWPPGTSVLLAPASLLPGKTVHWRAVKSTMALVGLSGVLLTWFYLARLSGRRDVADFGALLVALNPFYWDFSHQAMAEIPLTVWLIGGLLLVDCVWARRPVTRFEALGTGFACGIGMMFKGHAGGLVFAPLAYYVGKRGADLSGPSRLGRWALHVVGFAIPQLAWMIRGRLWPAQGFEGLSRFRSILAVDPNDASSRLKSVSEVAATILDNARHHVIYRLPEMTIPFLWPEGLLSAPGMGWIALALSGALLALAIPRRPELLAPGLAALVMAALNVAYAFGGAARFWFPISIVLLLMVAATLGPAVLDSRIGRHGAFRIAFAIFLAINLGLYIRDHEAHPYNRTEPWSEFADLINRTARRADLHPKGVLTANPAAFQLGTGLPAPWGFDDLTFDYLVIDTNVGQPPKDWPEVASANPWVMVALPGLMTREEIARQVTGTVPSVHPQ